MVSSRPLVSLDAGGPSTLWFAPPFFFTGRAGPGPGRWGKGFCLPVSTRGKLLNDFTVARGHSLALRAWHRQVPKKYLLKEVSG